MALTLKEKEIAELKKAIAQEILSIPTLVEAGIMSAEEADRKKEELRASIPIRTKAIQDRDDTASASSNEEKTAKYILKMKLDENVRVVDAAIDDYREFKKSVSTEEGRLKFVETTRARLKRELTHTKHLSPITRFICGAMTHHDLSEQLYIIYVLLNKPDHVINLHLNTAILLQMGEVTKHTDVLPHLAELLAPPTSPEAEGFNNDILADRDAPLTGAGKIQSIFKKIKSDTVHITNQRTIETLRGAGSIPLTQKTDGTWVVNTGEIENAFNQQQDTIQRLQASIASMQQANRRAGFSLLQGPKGNAGNPPSYPHNPPKNHSGNPHGSHNTISGAGVKEGLQPESGFQ